MGEIWREVLQSVNFPDDFSLWRGAVQHDCGKGLVDGLGSEGVVCVGDRNCGGGHEMEQGCCFAFGQCSV